MKKIDNLTVVAIDCYNYGGAVAALQKTLQQIQPAAAKFLTDIDVEVDGIDVVQIPRINSKEEYSRFVVKELHKHFDTQFVLVIQHDGYVLDGNQWDDRFMDYDYVGAPWLESDGFNVGNGGFSLRSKLLQEKIAGYYVREVHPEDVQICRTYRPYLENRYGIQYAPIEIAEKFAYELRQPNQLTFGFHGYFHAPYKPYVVIKRSAAMGDCIIMEPVMRHFALLNYNVVVDIPKDYYALYQDHYFPVLHISQFDSGRIKPERVINLDLAYEVKPRQNYLKSYFEFAGVKDYKLTRPQLYPLVGPDTKLFQKYVVIHVDERETPHRNTYGVDWAKLRRVLEAKGYVVIQVGHTKTIQAGIRMKTASLGYLKFLIAGCDLFIGVDSGPAHIAVAYNKPCVLLFGSVNANYIYPELENIEIVQGMCEKAFCWHIDGGTAGKKCEFEKDNRYLQCCNHTFEEVIDCVNKLEHQNGAQRTV